ncbi:MAG: PD-(D/E)XK nuclease family protein, partial [Thermoguttaceae bacterium]
PTQIEAAEFDRIMRECLAESLPATAGNPLLASLAEVDRRVISEWLSGYRDQHQHYDGLWKDCDEGMAPGYFEASFGMSRHCQGGFSIDDSLDFQAGRTIVHVAGRIDRIDMGKIGEKKLFNVLDYKTGVSQKVTQENVRRGTALQLPLYSLAVTELLLTDLHTYPWQAGYWHINSEGFKSRQAVKMYQLTENGIEPTQEWEEMRALLRETVVGLVKAIRRGCFPVFNEDRHCTRYCPLRTVCRIGQIRALEKKWQQTP